MEGWRLYHDPFYKSKEEQIPSDDVLGNPNRYLTKHFSIVQVPTLNTIYFIFFRDIWKACAWKISSDPKNSAYWRATIGILCGNIDAVLPVCHQWEDILWAHLHTIVNVSVENHIQSNRTTSIISLPEKYWEYK